MQSHEICNQMNAMGDATRFAIMERLMHEGELTAGDLAQPFDMSKPAISRHLKVLENAHLIERQTRAQFRVFRARADSLRKFNEWLEKYENFWNASFDRLEKVLESQNHQSQKKTGEET